MPYYQKSGEIPVKRHIQFRKPDGQFMLKNWCQLKDFQIFILISIIAIRQLMSFNR